MRKLLLLSALSLGLAACSQPAPLAPPDGPLLTTIDRPASLPVAQPSADPQPTDAAAANAACHGLVFHVQGSDPPVVFIAFGQSCQADAVLQVGLFEQGGLQRHSAPFNAPQLRDTPWNTYLRSEGDLSGAGYEIGTRVRFQDGQYTPWFPAERGVVSGR